MAIAVRKGIRFSGACLFGIYFAGLIYFLFFAESYGRGMIHTVNDANFLPFREIKRYIVWHEILGMRTVWTNLIGNILGFVPFGALLPLMSIGARNAWKVILLGAEISTLIEVLQLCLRVGCFDVDDIILNTAGAFLGYICYKIASKSYLYIERKSIRT